MTALAEPRATVDLGRTPRQDGPAARPREPGFDGWTLRRRLAVLLVAFGVVVSVGLVVAITQVRGVSRQQQYQVRSLTPAVNAVTALKVALLDQETGLRGYALTGAVAFRQPYDGGTVTYAAARRVLDGPATTSPGFQRALVGLDRAVATWDADLVSPLLAATEAGQLVPVSLMVVGKTDFDAIRAAEAVVDAELSTMRATVRTRLQDDIRNLEISMAALALVVLMVMAVVWFLMRSWITDPLEALGREVRIVSRGRLDHQVRATGAAEVRLLGADVEVMRARIAGEVDVAQDREAQLRRASVTMRARNDDLARSNAELEQFAYVASHDLQEPLRKIASFCQLLERRYGELLDDTGRKYIAFAVDGSKRMQVIINDLLTFSRTGRSTEAFVPVDLGEAARQALAAVDLAVKGADATVSLPAAWPTVPGQSGLLVLLLQNLLNNALKFRRDDVAPVVDVTAEEVVVGDEPVARVRVTDNGIGIDPQFADKVFALFQRLHARDAYEGTGIGLALCRKVVEYHDGRIWVDTDHPGPGTSFVFTLSMKERAGGDEQ